MDSKSNMPYYVATSTNLHNNSVSIVTSKRVITDFR